MLDTDTKHRIDTARDILVGKVPDPKSQVEQITIALIYKFMDDMDAESEEFGGKRKFFAKEFARYGWAKLMRSGLGGHETLNLYAEAITKMPENPGIPPLFRDIFKNAYLPYRDPETLRAFLKIIDEFEYDHSERLGDAFEYLLSVLGSQGDAGQFRTPRHIIDFMVKIIDPKKTETVLDPACGTAGFLISSWKHILKANTDAKGHNNLNPDEKGRLAANFKGYDISPDMVRLSLVNMYLHGFTDPHIYEYDTLTSQDRWNEYADIILANPPFMSPKGGIKPHNRFSIQAKRSEVLFVDYMAEHLTPSGRAGIIVPEGIIFQSQTAYKDLRKLLVENALVAVISLPAGVFNPYAGVKTSILILDKSLARQSDTIAFFKVENDGFGLGAQRRAIEKNDLPQVQAELALYLQALLTKAATDNLILTTGIIVPKEKIAANGDYILSGERYRVGAARATRFPIVQLGEVAEVVAGQSPPSESYNETGTGIPFYQGKTEFGEMFIGAPKTWTTDPQRFAESGDILISVRAPVGPVNLANQRLCIGRGLAAIKPIEGKLMPSYTFYFLRSQEEYIKGDAGAVFASINRSQIEAIQIPLPPLEVQKRIVAEIEGYQKVINGARAVIDNYRPHIPIHPDWPILRLQEVCDKITDGTHRTPIYTDSGVPFLRVTDITHSNDSKKFITSKEHAELIKRCKPEVGDVLYSKNGTIGVAKLVDWDWEFSIFVSLALLKPKRARLDSRYLESFLNSDDALSQATARSKSGTVTNLHLEEINEMNIPLPPLEIQHEIVAEIEAEQKLVAASQELIARFEKKIQATLARIWGKEK
ncbi:MAG: N-6 DNA methylase [Sedimentisphaerales bacterium]|nr:N-6 DNA methylase [Sedimentisphaerales bacterium]